MSYYDDHEFIEVVVKCRHATDEVIEFTGEEIVRCKECKHREEYQCRGIDDNFFCADGEREGE